MALRGLSHKRSLVGTPASQLSQPPAASLFLWPKVASAVLFHIVPSMDDCPGGQILVMGRMAVLIWTQDHW